MLRGIDISKHQGTIDFAKVKKAGIEFAILRSSYRKTVDSKFYEYVNGCNKNDIPIPSVYHFIYALTEQEVLEEAKFCVEQVKAAKLNTATIIFADFEYDTVNNAKKNGVILTKKECNSFTKIFCDYVHSAGYSAGIYANIDYYKNWYDKELLSNFYFWLADYNGEPDYKCLIQQYTSTGKVDGITGNVDLNYYFGEEIDRPETSRQTVVDLAISWEGKKESDGTYKSIIDIYNSFTGPFPRGIKMKYDWSWCACFWSAIAIKLGYTKIMPIEISCGFLIQSAKLMECWQENDSYIAKPGDAILYDWEDDGNGDNTGWPDHVGVIIETNKDAGYYIVMEGNYSNSVKRRTISINGKFIRGFITPNYKENSVSEPIKESNKDNSIIAKEVIAGIWGSGDKRKNALQEAGYNYLEIQKIVNLILNGSAEIIKPPIDQKTLVTKKIIATAKATKYQKDLSGVYKTATDLYCRNDAGTNKKALCLIPKNTEVQCYGYYSVDSNVKWLYIVFIINGVSYTGFSSSKYLNK